MVMPGLVVFSMSSSHKPIFLIDFNDSFTYNIAAELALMNHSVEIIPQEQAVNFLNNFNPDSDSVLIYGPGPGHPDEYQSLRNPILHLLDHPYIFHVGICMGHQLLWSLAGHRSVLSKKPIHGQAVSIEIPNWNDTFLESDLGRKVDVQRYNSLVVDYHGQQITNGMNFFKNVRCLYLDEELMISRFATGLSYQFHPESVGTSCPNIFFRVFTDKL